MWFMGKWILDLAQAPWRVDRIRRRCADAVGRQERRSLSSLDVRALPTLIHGWSCNGAPAERQGALNPWAADE